MGDRLVTLLEPLALPQNAPYGPECCILWPVWLLRYVADLIEPLRYPDIWEGDDSKRAAVAAVINEQIARLINYECCAPDDVGGITDDQYPECIRGGCGCQEDECDMANCFIPVGALRWNDGVLQYNTCQGWMDVTGDTIGTITTIPPDIDLDQTDVYACGKAANLAAQIVKLGDEAWDESDNQLPILFIWYIQDFMGLDLKNAWLQTLQNQALIMKGTVVASGGAIFITKAEVLPDGFEEDLVCKLLPAMSNTEEDDSETIWTQANLAIDQWFPAFATADNVFINNFWKYVLSSFGKAMLKDLAQAGAYDSTAECDCEQGTVVPPPVYSGLVAWEGTETILLESQGATISYNIQIAANILRITVRGYASQNYQEVQARENFVAYGTISELEIQIRQSSLHEYSAIPDYFPADEWSDTNPTAQSNYTMPVIGGVTAPDSTVYTQEHNLQKCVFKWDTPINLDAGYLEWGAKLNPKDQSGGIQEYYNEWVIVWAGDER